MLPKMASASSTCSNSRSMPRPSGRSLAPKSDRSGPELTSRSHGLCWVGVGVGTWRGIGEA